MMEKEIYFDNSATTKISAAALDTYIRISQENYGNPSSLHHRGQMAEKVLREARAALLTALSTREGQVIFTSGGTESNNLAIWGRVAAKERFRGGQILTTKGEHSSVSLPLAELRKAGYEILEIPTSGGALDLDFVEEKVTSRLFLATLMQVNNETGALYDLAAVKAILQRKAPEAILHCDATQSFGKLPLSPRSIGAELITVSSHKIHGPKGVGALWIHPSVLKNKGLAPREWGGGQEEGLRSGTENVPGIGAFATAVLESHKTLPQRAARMAEVRELLIEQIGERCPSVRCNLPKVAAPHILNITLPRIKSEVMLHHLSAKGICVSSGSACSSHGKGVSGALLSFGIPEKEADFSLRISLSGENTKEEAEYFLAALEEGIATLAKVR